VQSALRRRQLPYPLLGWPENEVTTSSRDAEMNTAGSTLAVNFNQLCQTGVAKQEKKLQFSLYSNLKVSV